MDNVKTISQWLDEPIQSTNAKASTAEWARSAKKEKNRRIDALCKAIGCHRVTILSYAKGNGMPNMVKRREIAKVIGCAVLFTKGSEVKVATP